MDERSGWDSPLSPLKLVAVVMALVSWIGVPLTVYVGVERVVDAKIVAYNDKVEGRFEAHRSRLHEGSTPLAVYEARHGPLAEAVRTQGLLIAELQKQIARMEGQQEKYHGQARKSP